MRGMRRPRRTTFLRAAAVAGSATTVGLGALGWWASGALTAVPRPARRPWGSLEVIEVGPGRVVLRGPSAGLPGRWGIAGLHGHGQVGPPLRETDDGVERALTVVSGVIEPGTEVQVEPYLWPDDPSTLGREWEDTAIEGPAGRLPAWTLPAGDGRTWAVCVHGRGASRAQAFRVMQSCYATGVTGLLITYRTDPEAAAADRCRLGADEWQDVEAAVRHALDRGAERVILIGFSMGGGMALSFLRHSPLAAAVRGVVLDAPVVDWSAVLRGVARTMRLPSWTAPLTMSMAARRAAIDWRVLDHVGNADELDAPILVLHGTADQTVPLSSSQRLAAERPELVELVEFPGAGHCTAYNADPTRYERVLRAFLRTHRAPVRLPA